MTIDLGEFQALQDAKTKAELALSQMQQEIITKKIEASDAVLYSISRAALEIVRFAVANLPPESIKGWPTMALRTIACELPAMPDTVNDDKEFALTLSVFADECDRYEHRGKVLGTR